MAGHKGENTQFASSVQVLKAIIIRFVRVEVEVLARFIVILTHTLVVV
jgi:hypothetical protein